MRLSWNRRHVLKTMLAAAGSLSASQVLRRGISVQAAEAPVDRWTSFRNGPQNPGLAGAALPDPLELLWTFNTPDGTASTAVIDAGRAYLGTLSGDLHCFHLKTGEVQWTYRSVEKVEPNSFAPGFNAPAAIDAQRVYLGDDQGIFHAVDRATGKKAWSVTTEGEIVGGAQLAQGHVLFGSHDGHLYCHAAETGKQIWKADTHGPVNATPCLAGNYTFTTGCDQPVLRVFEIQSGRQESEITLNSLLIASAAMRDDLLYFGTGDGIVFALDWKNKKTVWEFSVPENKQQIQSSPALTEELVLIGSRDKHLYALDRATGQLRWSFQTRSKIDSSPVVAGERVYFGSADRNVYGLDVATGKLVWKSAVKRSVTGSPAIAEGCLVIGTDSANGQILCFGKK